MIKVSLFYDGDNIKGFSILGHAGYAEAGSDIICSAVSMLAINTINSIEKLTEDGFTYQEEEQKGAMELSMKEYGPQSQLLLKAFELGVYSVEEQYGKKYIKVRKE